VILIDCASRSEGIEHVVVFNTLVFIDSFIPTYRNLFGGNSFLLDWLVASKVTYIHMRLYLLLFKQVFGIL